VNIRGNVSNPKVEFLYPIELAKDTVLIELEGIVVEEDCEYLVQIESYGKRVYAQEQLSSLLALGLESYVEKTFSSKLPDKPLFRVMSGPYLNKSEVNNARELLMKNGRQPLIYKKCTKT
jgi:cell division protein FtsN